MSKLKLLIVTGNFPSVQNKISGRFVYDRVRILKKYDIDVDVLLINSVLNRSFKFKYIPDYTTVDIFPHHSPITVKTINFVNMPYLSRQSLHTRVSRFYS